MWFFLLFLSAALAGDEPLLDALVEDFFVDLRGGLPETRVEAYTRACDAGTDWACNYQSWHRTTGARLGDGLTTFEDACDGGDPVACVAAGWALSRIEPSQPHPRAQDPAGAAQRFEQACGLGLERGCAELGLLLLTGTGIRPDADRAFSLIDDACAEGDSWACRLSAQHAARTGEDSANALFAAACDGGDPPSCGELAARTANPNAARQLIAHYDGMCDAGQPRACVALGQVWQTGYLVAPDLRRASSLYSRACQGGAPEGCTLLGLAHQAEPGGNEAQITDLFAQGCDGNHGLGCAWLGVRLFRGLGTAETSPEQALDASQRGCELGVPWSCANQASALRRGVGGPSNSTDAADRFREACANDVGWACRTLAEMYVAQESPAPREAPAPLTIEAHEGLLWVDVRPAAPWPVPTEVIDGLRIVPMTLVLAESGLAEGPVQLSLPPVTPWSELEPILTTVQEQGIDQVELWRDKRIGTLLLVEGAYRDRPTLIVDDYGVLLLDPRGRLEGVERVFCKQLDCSTGDDLGKLGRRLDRLGGDDVLLVPQSDTSLGRIEQLMAVRDVRVTPAWSNEDRGRLHLPPVRNQRHRWSPRREALDAQLAHGDARDGLLALLEVQPSSGAALVQLSRILLAADRADPAVIAAWRATQLYPDREEALRALYVAAHHAGDPELATQAGSWLVRRGSPLPTLMRPLARTPPEIRLGSWLHRPEPLRGDEFVEAVQARRAEFRGCYRQVLARNPGAAGQVQIAATIGLDGWVEDARIEHTELSREADACFIEAMRGVRVRPVPTIWFGSYPFVFP